MYIIHLCFGYRSKSAFTINSEATVIHSDYSLFDVKGIMLIRCMSIYRDCEFYKGTFKGSLTLHSEKSHNNIYTFANENDNIRPLFFHYILVQLQCYQK